MVSLQYKNGQTNQNIGRTKLIFIALIILLLHCRFLKIKLLFFHEMYAISNLCFMSVSVISSILWRALATGEYSWTLVDCAFFKWCIAILCISVFAWSLNEDVRKLLEPSMKARQKFLVCLILSLKRVQTVQRRRHACSRSPGALL